MAVFVHVIYIWPAIIIVFLLYSLFLNNNATSTDLATGKSLFPSELPVESVKLGAIYLVRRTVWFSVVGCFDITLYQWLPTSDRDPNQGRGGSDVGSREGFFYGELYNYEEKKIKICI
jgi:hypothetical protein